MIINFKKKDFWNPGFYNHKPFTEIALEMIFSKIEQGRFRCVSVWNTNNKWVDVLMLCKYN